MRKNHHRLASWIFASLFAVMATYHLFVLFDAFAPREDLIRHAIFLAIDSFFMALLWYWPRWLIILIGILTVQQTWAHAPHFRQMWQNGHQIDWLFLATSGTLFVLMGVLLREEIERRRN